MRSPPLTDPLMTDFSARSGRKLVILLSVALSLVFGAAQYVLIVSPTLRTVLHLDTAAFGWLLSSWMALGIGGSLVGGWLADRGHLRHVAYGAIALLVFSYGLCALPPGHAHAYVRYLIGIAFTGLANAALATVGNVALTRAFPLGARKALTWLQVSISAAGMVAPPLWAWLLTSLSATRLGTQGAVQALFLLAGGVCLVAFFALFGRPLPEAPPEPENEATAPVRNGPTRALFGWPLVVVALFTTLHAAADNGAFLWIPDFVERRFSPSPFPAAWILSGVSGAYFVGRLILVNLPDRWRDLTFVTYAAGGGALFLFLAFQSDNQYTLAALYITGALFMSADYPSIMAHIGQLFPQATGRVMAVAAGVAQAFSVLLPPAIGYVGKAAGSMVVGMMIPPAMLATLSVAALLWRTRLDRASTTGASDLAG